MIQGVTYILNNDATFQGIAGLNKAGAKYKAYPVICPLPEEAPYSVVLLTGKISFGQCKDADTTFSYSFDVVSYHKNFEDVVTLDEAVVDALVGKTGTYNSIVFNEIRFDNTRDGEYSSEYALFFYSGDMKVRLDKSWTNMTGKKYPIGTVLDTDASLGNKIIKSKRGHLYEGDYPNVKKSKTNFKIKE